MKIVYLHQYFTTPEMAGGTRSYMMALRLVQAGHEVHMVTAYRDPKARRGEWRERVDGDPGLLDTNPILQPHGVSATGAVAKFAIRADGSPRRFRQISCLRQARL